MCGRQPIKVCSPPGWPLGLHCKLQGMHVCSCPLYSPAVMPGVKLQEHAGNDKAWVWSAVDFADESQKVSSSNFRGFGQHPRAVDAAACCRKHTQRCMHACMHVPFDPRGTVR